MGHPAEPYVEKCPICGEPFVVGDICATDITEGACHAECLDGSAIVDLETGDPVDGPVTTFAWEPDPFVSGYPDAPPPSA